MPQNFVISCKITFDATKLQTTKNQFCKSKYRGIKLTANV